MKRAFYLFLISIFCVQCDNNTATEVVGDQINVLSFNELTTTSELRDCIEDVLVYNLNVPADVRLDLANKIIRTGNGGFAIMSFYDVWLFDADGGYIGELCEKGYGEKESPAISDIAVNNKLERIYILDALNKILIFNSSTGELAGRISPKWEDDSYRIDGLAVNEEMGGFYIVSANTGERKGKDERYVVTEFNGKGAQVAQHLLNDDYILPRSMVSQSASNQYLMRPLDGENVIYELKNGEPNPLYTLDFGEFNSPKYSVYSANGILRLAKYFANDYYKYITAVTRTPHTLSFIAAMPAGGAAYYVYDQQSGNGIRYGAKDVRAFRCRFTWPTTTTTTLSTTVIRRMI